MNIFASIRERIGSAVGAVIGAFFLLSCGAVLAFILSPQQALEARRIDKMPLMDAGSVAAAAAGEEILVTGWLADNPLMDEGSFVAYILDEWVVTLPDPDDSSDEPDGDWETVERVVPELNIEVEGEMVRTLEGDNVRLTGSLNEELIYSDDYDEAKYEGEWLPHGSLRLRGFFNGDLVSVLGKKGSVGGIIPEELYAGDRVAFADSKHDAARGMFIGGIVMMACAPLLLVGGALGALFGRRQRSRR